MDRDQFELTVLGTRGSMPVAGSQYIEFGGATSCYLVRAGDENIFLDAGTGMAHAPAVFPKPPTILITHMYMMPVVVFHISLVRTRQYLFLLMIQKK